MTALAVKRQIEPNRPMSARPSFQWSDPITGWAGMLHFGVCQDLGLLANRLFVPQFTTLPRKLADLQDFEGD